MPSFDVVSEVDMHEVTNAVDQASREVGNRFDFKGSDSNFTREAQDVIITSESDFQVRQMLDVLQTKMSRRGIDIACLELGEVEEVGRKARMRVTVRVGLDSDLARRIVKEIKNKKMKVQAAVQGGQVRISGKKRDDLQQVIAALRELDVDMPLQYINMRD